MEREHRFLWLLTGLFTLLGIGIHFIPGYSFSSCVAFGIAFLLLLFQLLRLLSRKHEKPARVLRRILIAALCLGLAAAAITGVYIGVQGSGSADAPCGYVIVLGAGVNGSTPSLSLRERLDAAYAYLTAHPDTICIVSGGQGNGENITEAQCMYNDLTARGISEDRIWMEDKAASTEENIVFSLALIEARTGSRPETVGIISAEYHLCRAKLMAKAQNVQPIGIPAKTTWITLRINYFLREIVGVWYYLLFGG